ncbi:MAG TPA: HAMP domain-containing sensor histidine kinase [Candidatus Polarisedimenticolaceae bacterium]|nr:HAMP domain-containing sensor histidine kinase [Candidatus Polarisedimenticolaceae bacterium]
MIGLRGRIFLVVSGVALLAVVAVAVRGRDVAVVAFEREVRGPGVPESGPRLAAFEVPLAQAYARDGDWRNAQALLETLAAGGVDRYLLADWWGKVVASFPPSSAEAKIRPRGDGGVEVESWEGGQTRVAVLVGAPSLVLRAPDGTMAGRLVRLPPREGTPPVSQRFARQLDRGLLVVAALVLVLAWAAAWWLARRLTGPLAELTDAARAIERGELERRVGALGGGEIGALGRAFDAMAEARGKAEAARRRLVADVAHELRTPLTHLRCRIEAAEDGLLPADPGMLRILHEEVAHLSRLVQDLQDLAMADAGALRLELQELDAAEETRRAVDAARAVAQARGIVLEASASSPAPRVRADAVRLRQVLGNLLDNALTATPAGGRVWLRVGAANGSVSFEVADTGPGVPADKRDAVFEPFLRLDGARARGTGGAGLGLAIVRRWVEAHGGRVALDEAPGGGARVRVSLPAA